MYSNNSKITLEQITQLIHKLGYLLNKNDLVIDSRKMVENAIFCAYPGFITDGRQFIPQIIQYHPSCILWDNTNSLSVPVIPVMNYALANLSHYVGILASAKYGYPSTKLNTVGITGTNGKTSIAHWLSQAHLQLGIVTGVVGTTGAGIYPNLVYNDTTTPDPIMLQMLLNDFVKVKADSAVIEVSSHALHQGRVNGVNFITAVFSNLTQDHLDYHGDMENYYLAKRDLFYWNGLKNAVINVDDQYGIRLVNELSVSNSKLSIISYGITQGDIRATDLISNLSGMTFNIVYKNEQIATKVKVIGKFNVYNLLAVAGVLIYEGVSLHKIGKLFANFTSVCGRMNAIIIPNKPLVVVDFSHTPDSLEKALTVLREIEHSGKLLCVFGCGGNRDTKKRPIMGRIASLFSDIAIITSDNPRFEDPKAIIDQIVVGANQKNCHVIINRKEAIKYALDNATSGDIVLIAGKGHESYQDIQGVKYEFSDFDIAHSFLGE